MICIHKGLSSFRRGKEKYWVHKILRDFLSITN